MTVKRLFLGLCAFSFLAGGWGLWSHWNRDDSEISESPEVREPAVLKREVATPSSPFTSSPSPLLEEKTAIPEEKGPAAACVPERTACPSDYACGYTDDGCGQAIDCGTCEGGKACIHHQCAPPPKLTLSPYPSAPAGSVPSMGFRSNPMTPFSYNRRLIPPIPGGSNSAAPQGPLPAGESSEGASRPPEE